MKITEDVCKRAAQLGIAEEAALKKSRKFTKQGGELYAKGCLALLKY